MKNLISIVKIIFLLGACLIIGILIHAKAHNNDDPLKNWDVVMRGKITHFSLSIEGRNSFIHLKINEKHQITVTTQLFYNIEDVEENSYGILYAKKGSFYSYYKWVPDKE